MSTLASHPRAMAVMGALTIAWSSILVRLAETTPSTAAVFRCVYAMPVLLALAWLEDRRLGPRPARGRMLALLAGVFFAVDLITWHHAIADVGAGLATVLANVQVIMVPFAAWMVLGERPGRRLAAALPVILLGIVLISGALEDGAYGAHPLRGVAFAMGTGVTYAAFLLILRAGGADLRRPAGPLADATLVAAAVSVAIGYAAGEADYVPDWPSHGWLLLLALSSQVVGWLLITSSLPRLPAALTSVLITIQPVGSVLLGVLIFSEAPSGLQFAGVLAIIGGVVFATRRATA
jgi:drug/metabolite transporter (DMT)-like permease